MRKYEPRVGETIDQAYQMMVQEKDKHNEECMCHFNGKELTTEMTLDECYLAVIGKTKAEVQEELREAEGAFKRRREEFLSHVQEYIDANIERARGLVSEEDFEDYKEVADVRFRDIYEGMEMNALLDILEVYRDTDGDIDSCKRLFDAQGHSGMSAQLTAALADKFVSLGIGKYLLGE